MSDTPTSVTLGAKIAAARDAAQMRPEALAAALEVSVETLRRYESGRTVPSYLAVVRVAELTGKPVDWFVETEAVA
jgi:transcriptional regulator with XRE-family HTH domain